MAQVGGDYQFSAEPQPVRARRSKYREPLQETTPATNIMFDRRVVRGNTYAAMVIPASTQQEIERQQEKEKKRLQRKDKSEADQQKLEEREISTPEPVDGRQHIDVQTENLLEELTDKPVEYEIDVQTDFYIDRPPTPQFIPTKRGKDTETQVEDGELFDFDLEVQPILEVLVGKTLEQARMEVLEEEELEAMRKHQREFEQKRNAELLEVQRLEAEEMRKREEAERRKLQAKTRKEQMQLAHQKFCCRIISKRFLNSLKKTALENLEDLGVFTDPREVSFHDQLIPWLVNRAHAANVRDIDFTHLSEAILKEAYAKLCKMHSASINKEKQKRENKRLEDIRIAQETEQRKQTRRELRAIRKAEQEKEALRQRIENEIIATGQMRDAITTHPFSDLFERTTEPVVGTIGGTVGELILFISVLESVIEHELTFEEIRKLIREYAIYMKSPSIIFRNPDVDIETLENRLSELDGTFNLEQLHSNTPESLEHLQSLLLTIQPGRSTLGMLAEHSAEFEIREDLIPLVLRAIFALASEKDSDDGIPNLIRPKLQIKPRRSTEAVKDSAVVRIRIPVVHDPTPEPLQDSFDEEKRSPVPPREVEGLEDRVLMITPVRDDLSVYVLHQAAQRSLRNELLEFIKTQRDYDGLELDRMRQSLFSKASFVEERILESLAKDLHVFDFHIN